MEIKYEKRAKEVGISFANGLYKDWFIKSPEMGPNFTWEKFPNICGCLAKVNTFTSFSIEEWYEMTIKQRDELEKICYEAAFKGARDLLNS
uniref:Uncharacterized protein n=1 Tax=viral metagenome TaxID=1070528 RepID=A0A6H1ZRP9_9ZZZZ